ERLRSGSRPGSGSSGARGSPPESVGLCAALHVAGARPRARILDLAQLGEDSLRLAVAIKQYQNLPAAAMPANDGPTVGRRVARLRRRSARRWSTPSMTPPAMATPTPALSAMMPGVR